MSANIQESEKFKAINFAKPAGPAVKLKGKLPGERLDKGAIANETVTAYDSNHTRTIELKEKIAEGGEGSVFTTSIDGYVAKIYKREKLTTDREQKLKIMISKPLRCKGVCFPEALILNEQKEFVGYLMPQAKGIELGKSIFQPKLLLQKFPKWNKLSTIDLSLTILKKIEYLNARNVILGDINPANILVVSPQEVYFVDCDSYQIEGYPCPVGTANFTAPEAQGKDYKTFLRTQEMENFAVATLLFMIMLPGKPPYSAIGGESPEKNIRDGNFAYPQKETATDRVPPGKWGYIWNHMSYKTTEAFYENFKKGEKHFAPKDRRCPTEWIKVFDDYRYALENLMSQSDSMSLEIFPTRRKKRQCKNCNDYYVPDGNNYTPYCAKCDALLGWKKSINRSTSYSRSVSTQTASSSVTPRAQSKVSGYSSAASVSGTTSGSKIVSTSSNVCPICKVRTRESGSKYCWKCGNAVVETRRCATCYKSFSVTRKYDDWEKSHSYKKTKCDTCQKANCTTAPCRHAEGKPTQSAYRSSPVTSHIAGSSDTSKSTATQSKISGYSNGQSSSQQNAKHTTSAINKPQTNKSSDGDPVRGCVAMGCAVYLFICLIIFLGVL